MKYTPAGMVRVPGLICLCLCMGLMSPGGFAQGPIASFSTNVNTGCAPLNVNFTNTSSQSNSYYWNFGNGNTSTLLNPSMVFSTNGAYNVVLVAINSITGQRDTTSQVITVVSNPVANFSGINLSSCAGSTPVIFTNSSSNASSYTWDFGDGNLSNAVNPSHLYTTAGNYTVKLIADNGYGCPDLNVISNFVHIHANPVAAFTSNLTSTCNVNTVFNFNCTSAGVNSWSWNFGDGSTATTAAASHTYSAPGSYTITLIVTDIFGCSDTLVAPNYINIGPSLVPSFTVNDTSGCVPFSCNFICTVPNATTWLWDFGDGTTSTQQNPVHLYASPGNFNLTLTVTTASGCNGSVVLNNFISVDALPLTGFTPAQDSGCIPFTASFSNTSAGGVRWLWDFGDGTSDTVFNPAHTYNLVGSYQVTLHTYSANGCESIYTVPNSVVAKDAVASFNASNNIGCPPLNVGFNSNASTGNIVSWLWQFGDGFTSSLQNPSHVYNSIGTYSIRLIVTSSLGCVDTFTRYNYVKVVSGVTSYTPPDTIELCQPGVLSCVDPTFGSNSWSWNFGDGTTSNQKNPVHNYPNPGIYIITLTNSMPGGCTQTFNPYAIVRVTPYVPSPIISISVSPCPPYILSLNDTSSMVSSYSWNFGDGSTSVLQNPVHTYSGPGTYVISLTLTMQSGCTVSKTKTVVVGHQNPIVASGTQFCLSTPVQFNVSNPGAFLSYYWDFGDGNNSTQQNPLYTYSGTGSFQVGLITVDTSSCVDTFYYPSMITISDPVASFSVTGPSTGCSNLLVTFTNTSTGANSYVWDFGDGGTSTATNPTHLYSNAGVYSVTLTASANGCTRTTTHANQVIINAPSCNFMYNYSSGCLPVTVNYTDLSPNAVAWAWNFGDGTTSNLKNPVHVFTSAPSGNVTLTIVDAFGCTKTRIKANINVLSANFTSDTIVCRNAPVTFTNLSSAGGIAWFWDFGDGNTSVLQHPVHQYQFNGTYSVSLITTFAAGCSDTVIFSNYISVHSPQADFISPTLAGCSPSIISFNNLSANASSYLWSFGDSTSSTVPSPVHIYSIPGYYTINLVAMDSFGCHDSLQKVNYIAIPGTYAQFTISSTSGCEMLNAQFTDLSVNASSWSWNFGDGSTSNVQHPSHVYNDSGTFAVTLITQDTLGCQSFYSFPTPVIIYADPVASAICMDTSGCQPYTATFSNASVAADSYLWVFGDGDTSTQTDPVHTYLNDGLYVPYLVASNANGCRDTFYISPGIQVLKQPGAAITSNGSTGCAPVSFAFSDQSLNTYLPSYAWSSGNGTTSNQSNPVFSYSTPGSFSISMVITNANGCSDTAGMQVNISGSPVAGFTTTDTIGCVPLATQFNNLSSNAASFLWDFGDGSTDTSASPVHVYTVSGTYSIKLIAENGSGCTDTFKLPFPVQVNDVPVVNFSADTTSGCPGNTFNFTNLSTGVLPGASFNWSVGNSISSILQNPSVVISSPGFFDVTLVIENANGCIDSLSKLQFIEVFDSIPPPVSPIRSVSVSSDSTVEITWKTSSVSDFGAYVLSRYDVNQGGFVPVLVDSSQHSQGMVVTVSNTDTVLNTLGNVYTYLLETFDRCGNVISGSALNPHSTMDITALSSGKNISVSWTPYGGCPVENYVISRKEMPSGNWTVIDSVKGTVLSYLDTTLSCPVTYAYHVTATDLCGEGFVSGSDTSVAIPENQFSDQEVEIVRSTVIDNKKVLTEWLPPVVNPDRVVVYNIYRSADSLNYKLIASVPAMSQSYLDDNVNVSVQNYFYRIFSVNDCNFENTRFTNSSSILLKGEWGEHQTNLFWTRYRQWDAGVNQYVIEKLDENGNWKVVKVVDGSIQSASVDE